MGSRMTLSKISMYIERNTKIKYRKALFTKLHYT